MQIKTIERLSDKEYWDEILKKADLPRLNSPENYNYSVTMNFIHPFLEVSGDKKFLEIGAGSSGWLPYFAQRYGYKVSGLDYSEIGCKIAETNLNLLNIRYDKIICKDIFEWQADEQYDIIFTYGVVEHFTDPERILRIIYNRLRENGLVITLIPNLMGLPGLLTKYFMNDIYKIHLQISKTQLIKMHTASGFNNLRTNYAGIFSLGVIPWVNSNNILFKKDTMRRTFILRVMWKLDKFLNNIFKKIKKDFPSKYFSPYIIAVAKK